MISVRVETTSAQRFADLTFQRHPRWAEEVYALSTPKRGGCDAECRPGDAPITRSNWERGGTSSATRRWSRCSQIGEHADVAARERGGKKEK